jgi:hypothetical protein
MKTRNFLEVGSEYKPVEIRMQALQAHKGLVYVPTEKARRGLPPWKVPLDAAEKGTSWLAGVWGRFSRLPAAAGGTEVAG